MECVKYRSGTDYELLDAINANSPETIIYRRMEDKLFHTDDTAGQAQYQQVKTFFGGELFYDPTTKEIRRGVNQYRTPADFREKFETHLEELVVRLLAKYEKTTRPADPPPASPDIVTITSKRWQGSPFPGLRSFTRDDAPIFFGRARETDTLVRQVADRQFVAVIGASGSGKSTLVGAGLLPRLEANAISNEDTGSKDWHTVQFTPGQGEHPFGALFDAIIKAFDALRPSAFEIRRVRQAFINDMETDAATVCDTLVAALETIHAPPWAEVLLFIDQSEELFTLANPDHIPPFVAMLKQLVDHPRIRVIVTMRHDFVHRAIEVPDLAELLNLGTFHLPPPTLGALAQMIKRPAELAELELADGLAEQILTDMGYDAGALALMAYTLDELYKVADQRHDRQLTFDDYAALGGVRGAIGKRAEEVFQKLPLDDKETLLAHVFRELVEVDERGTATRQRAIQARFGEQEMQLVRAFTDARLLVMDEDDVEVAHEALFRNWERLAAWIAAAQEDLILLRQVRNAAHDWESKGRPDFLLWQQERLALVYEMQTRLSPELSDVERDFIEPEQTRLLSEIADIQTDHHRRRWIGERLALIGDPRTGIGLNSHGLPDVEWLPINQGGEIEIAGHNFTVTPFQISRYLITYSQFQAFIDAPDGFHDMRWWQGFAEAHIHQPITPAVAQFHNYPRDSISWYHAVAFGRWLDFKYRERGLISDKIIRLPLEWEWQWAAQHGTDKRPFAWGDWDEHPRANTTEAGIGDRSTAVGMYPYGAAQCGALDMTGNLWEWCQNDFTIPEIVDGYASEERKVLRGGSFSRNQASAMTSSRYGRYSSYNNAYVGIRLVMGDRIPV